MQTAIVKVLTEELFNESPLWRYDDSQDSYFPVKTPDDLPADIRDLFIKSVFHCSNGMKLNGYIVASEVVFSIAIFSKNKLFYFNRNFPESLFNSQFRALTKTFSGFRKLRAKDIFPVKFETCFDWEHLGYSNFHGTFTPI